MFAKLPVVARKIPVGVLCLLSEEMKPQLSVKVLKEYYFTITFYCIAEYDC